MLSDWLNIALQLMYNNQSVLLQLSSEIMHSDWQKLATSLESINLYAL